MADKAGRVSVVEGRRELHDILRAGRVLHEKRTNPFLFDLRIALDTADRYFPAWREVPDLVLDARVMNALASVVKLQEARLEYEARLFHADPEAMAEKLSLLDPQVLARVFLEAWHPIVELEQLTPQAIEDAMSYWAGLLPMKERLRERPRREPPKPEDVSLDDLMARGVLRRDGFSAHVEELWEELRERGEVPYLAFVAGKDYPETVRRAYATSFLVTYGYASLHPETGALSLEPRDRREPQRGSRSFAVALEA